MGTTLQCELPCAAKMFRDHSSRGRYFAKKGKKMPQEV